MSPTGGKFLETIKVAVFSLQNAQNLEASNGVQELNADDQQQGLYQMPQPYGVYPGYIFPAPLYNYNGKF